MAARGKPTRTRSGARRRTANAARTTVVQSPTVDTTEAGRRFSIRTLVFGMIVLIVVGMFVPSLNTAISQAQQISALNAEIDATTEEVGHLRAKQERLHDQDYLAQRAREEMNYVKPGQKSYVVIGAEDQTSGDKRTAGTASDAVSRDNEVPVRSQPWYIELLDSLKAVGFTMKEST